MKALFRHLKGLEVWESSPSLWPVLARLTCWMFLNSLALEGALSQLEISVCKFKEFHCASLFSREALIVSSLPRQGKGLALFPDYWGETGSQWQKNPLLQWRCSPHCALDLHAYFTSGFDRAWHFTFFCPHPSSSSVYIPHFFGASSKPFQSLFSMLLHHI